MVGRYDGEREGVMVGRNDGGYDGVWYCLSPRR